MRVPEVRQPRILQTAQWIWRPCDFLRESAVALGDVFAVDVMGLGRLVLISDPELVYEVFRGDPAILRTGESNSLVAPVLGSSSLLVVDAPEHLRVRRIVDRDFSRAAIEGYVDDISFFAAELVREIPLGREFSVHQRIRRMTLRFMLTAVFGVIESQRFEEYRRVFAPLTGELVGVLAYLTPLQVNLGAFSPGGWLRKRIKELDELVHREMREQERNLDQSKGILARLLRSRADGCCELDDRQIRDHVVTLLGAGHETVATALAWALYWVTATPGVAGRIRDELEELEGDFRSAKYLEAACLEALRITPVAEAVSRVASKSIRVGDFEIEAGDLVSPAIQLVHHRTEVYPNPSQYRPERFLESTFRSCEYFPFGGGQRKCLGRNLAIEEMKIVLGTLLSNLDLDVVDAKPPRSVRRNVTIAPSTGTRLIATRRD